MNHDEPAGLFYFVLWCRSLARGQWLDWHSDTPICELARASSIPVVRVQVREELSSMIPERSFLTTEARFVLVGSGLVSLRGSEVPDQPTALEPLLAAAHAAAVDSDCGDEVAEGLTSRSVEGEVGKLRVWLELDAEPGRFLAVLFEEGRPVDVSWGEP